MRSALARLALLPLLALPLAAAADPLDDISITNTAIGFDAEFSLPASFTTIPFYFGNYEFVYGPEPGTFNGQPTVFDLAFYPFTSAFGPILTGIGAGSLNGFLQNFQNTITYYPPTPYETLTIVPGSYVSSASLGNSGTVYFLDVTVTPESATVTPEPPTLLLVGTVLLASAMLLAGKHRSETRHSS